MGNAREVGIYDLKIGGKLKNRACGFGRGLGSGHKGNPNYSNRSNKSKEFGSLPRLLKSMSF
jgi:hypothetical protein